MQAEPTPTDKPRVVRNRGLTEFSKKQGVTVMHAWRVIEGQRRSDRLLAAWQKFKAELEVRS